MFKHIESINIGRKRINWFVTTFAFIIDIVTSNAIGELYKERDQLVINYAGKRQTISLANCDIDKAKKVVSEIITTLINST